ncbi:hypothetical protein T10_10706 [Trichinella papuae]|uniref:Uncharacterized protein n=1 Tax=Trichinella papuae TaxID=268474 RepID=A0A0V1LXW3_9BILA|nr:hypothetical protein T10_10706 [Trichinella papuae]
MSFLHDSLYSLLLFVKPSWNDARLYHGDITEFLELEYR